MSELDQIKALLQKIEQREKNPNKRPPPPPPGTAVEHDIKALAKQEHTCPKCGHEGLIGEDFGLRTDKYGRPKFQSWCRPCRNSPEAHPSRAGGLRTYRNRR